MRTRPLDLLAPKQDIPRGAYLLISTSTVLLIAVIWCCLSYGGFVRDIFLPTPGAVVTAAAKGISDGTLFTNTFTSIAEVFSGFLLASLIALPLGIFMGSFKSVEAAIEPVVNFFRYLPVSALIPLLILWIGIGFEQKVAVIFIGTFFQQLILFADVSRRVSKDLLDVAYTLGARRTTVVSRVLMPATMPGVMDTLRITLGWAWTYVVTAELIASDKGLGYYVLNSMRGLLTEQMFVGVFTIGFLGLLFDQIFKLLKSSLLPWTSER